MTSPPGFPVGGFLPGGDESSTKQPGDDEGCPHCKHVDILWGERAEIKQLATVVNVKLESLAMAVQILSNGGGDGGGRATQLNASHHGCHCKCLDAVDQRLVEVEKHLLEAGDYLRRIASLELQTAALVARQQPTTGGGWPQADPGAPAAAAPGAPTSFLSGGVFNPAPQGAD